MRGDNDSELLSTVRSLNNSGRLNPSSNQGEMNQKAIDDPIVSFKSLNTFKDNFTKEEENKS